MVIRQAQLNDSESIAKIQVMGWKTTYTGIVPEVYLETMTWEERVPSWRKIISSQVVYVAENQNKEVIGFCHVGKSNDENYQNFDSELYSFYILKECQRKGIGKLLFNKVTKDLKKKGTYSLLVKVLEENPSKYFYESLGAEYVDTIKVEISGEKLNELVYSWQDI